MNRYNVIKTLGDGTYGQVFLAQNKETSEKIAIKKMKKKYYDWNEALNLREVRSLRKLQHYNIVKLKEVVREKDYLYLIFEYMHENLYQLTKDRKRYLPEPQVAQISYQIIKGLSYLHKSGYFHRDLKPENLLCNGPELVKIADFGLAREIRSKPPYTDYVSTRWYRAPEILLRSTTYSAPVDLWAVGCIICELWSLRPLFPGTSELDQLFKICTILGVPNKHVWPEGHNLAQKMNFKWPVVANVDVKINLKRMCPPCSPEGLELITDLLKYPPRSRPTADACLKYKFFKNELLRPKISEVKLEKNLKISAKPSLSREENNNFVGKDAKINRPPTNSVVVTPNSDDIDNFLSSIPTKPKAKSGTIKHPLNMIQTSNQDNYLSDISDKSSISIKRNDTFTKHKIPITKAPTVTQRGDSDGSIISSTKKSKKVFANDSQDDLMDMIPAKINVQNTLSPNTSPMRTNINRNLQATGYFNKLNAHNNQYTKFTTTKNSYQKPIVWSKNGNEVQYRKAKIGDHNQTFPNNENDLDALLGISKMKWNGSKKSNHPVFRFNNQKNRDANSNLEQYPKYDALPSLGKTNFSFKNNFGSQMKPIDTRLKQKYNSNQYINGTVNNNYKYNYNNKPFPSLKNRNFPEKQQNSLRRHAPGSKKVNQFSSQGWFDISGNEKKTNPRFNLR